MVIKENVMQIRAELPDDVGLVAAAKHRTPDEIQQAIDAGVEIIGENYVQEAVKAFAVIGKKAQWHFIGHLQKNKVNKAVEIFDLIETVDSIGIAESINEACARSGKTMAVLIEINSGRESQKFGVLPEKAEALIRQVSSLANLRVSGLMTMGPRFGDPEDSRPFFKETKAVFDSIKSLALPGVKMQYLSMGMSNAYKIAIEEGANLVRIGTKIFGERNK
ncbi:MAG: YggS family pyridoxal phosphate-dependent enzyme [Candidatus Margulisiibacteriota bacterium]|nr:YggS family pyridoxal phosphate-dependent enzyme [Candidatus Margulisiibacteriota bacterium]